MQRNNYVKTLGVPPGPPTQMGIYASPEFTGVGYPVDVLQDVPQNNEPPEGWPRKPYFNPPGDVPGPPAQWGPPITPEIVKPEEGFIGNDVPENDIFFFHPDHLGSTSCLTGKNGEITQNVSYLPFGDVFFEEHNSKFQTKYLFNGKLLDEETNMSYFSARYKLGKFDIWESVDPLAMKMPNVGSYVYCFNNPLSFTDPDGMDPVAPGYYAASLNSRYVGFGLRHPIASFRIGFGVTKGASDISTNATRFATRGEVLYGSKRGQRDEGSENGAFRHTLWQSSIASEFGSQVAKEAGNTHEKNPFADLSKRSFSSLAEADQTVDLLNNVIGRKIGKDNSGADMSELANLVLDEFKNNGLYTATKDKDGNWNISKTKLSPEKYNQLKDILKTLNKDGRTSNEQQVIENKAKKEIESMNRNSKL